MPYLDHAGATLPSEKQMEEVTKFLKRQRLSNPHSHHSSSTATKQIVDNVRQRILSFFNTKEYTVIFTANSSHSLKIIGESFIFPKNTRFPPIIKVELTSEGPSLAYLADSHHSVVGMREIVKDRVDFVSCLASLPKDQEIPKTEGGLFVLTAMSNFCGYKYDLNVIRKLQEKGWSVCLDAAGFVSSSPLDLSEFRPNFVVLSFYKIFGYPTGLGALLVRNDSSCLLQKKYFGGGGINAVLPGQFTVVYREKLEEKFEDGTLNYYGIAALMKGFDDLERYGKMIKIQEKSFKMAHEALKMLESKFHWNGKPATVIYRRGTKAHDQGPIVTFNILREDGTFVGYSEVAKMSDLFGIDLRTGCFCNIGACQQYLGLTDEDILANIKSGKRCGDEQDLINGRPTGAVRISFGRMSSSADVAALEQMIDYCFLAQRMPAAVIHPLKLTAYRPILSKMFCYPVKSCRGYEISISRLKPTGLENDRKFMIVKEEITMSQKKYPEMCRILAKPENAELELTAEGVDPLIISLKQPEINGIGKIVCSDSVATVDCGVNCGAWLSKVLDHPNCRLQMATEDSDRSLSNQAPFLLINEASAQIMATQIGLTLDNVLGRFRPNLVVRGIPAFIEDTVTRFRIGNCLFEVIDKCTRCEMICVNQNTGEKDPRLIVTLRDLRDRQKMTFGIYVRQLNHREGDTISTGDEITFIAEEGH